MADFADLVGAWAKESEARMEAVYRRSVELLADEMTTTRANGGKLPHKTGNLMRSLLASTAGLPSQGGGDQKWGSSGQKFDGAQVGLVTASLKLGQAVWLGYQANYARRMNYGFSGKDSKGRQYSHEGAGFVEYAMEMWPTIVELAADDIRSGVESRG